MNFLWTKGKNSLQAERDKLEDELKVITGNINILEKQKEKAENDYYQAEVAGSNIFAGAAAHTNLELVEKEIIKVNNEREKIAKKIEMISKRLLRLEKK